MSTTEVSCTVRGCNSKESSGLQFFPIPRIIDNPKYKALSTERQQKWLKVIDYDKIDSNGILVCSRHFMSGTYAILRNNTSPDWVPNLHLGQSDNYHLKKLVVKLRRHNFGTNAHVNKVNKNKTTDKTITPPQKHSRRASHFNKKIQSPTKKKVTTRTVIQPYKDAFEGVVVCRNDYGDTSLLISDEENLQISDTESFGDDSNLEYDEPNITYVPVVKKQGSLLSKRDSTIETEGSYLKESNHLQKNLNLAEKDDHFEKMINSYEQKIKDLDYELNELKFNNNLKSSCLDSLQLNDEKVKTLTGLQNFTVLNKLYDVVKDSLNNHSTLGITQFNSFVVTLMKLRLDLPISVLAYLFDIAPQPMAKMYLENLSTMNSKIGPLVKWPDDRMLLLSTPSCFKEIMGEKCIILIHFLEVILKNLSPSNTAVQYTKHKIRYLIAFTASGEIIFVSQGFGSNSSNEDIIKESGFFDQITENHVILSVEDMFTEAYKDNEEVQSIKEIAKQTETKVLDVLKDNFRILFNRQATNYHGEVYSAYTVRCCCALANLQMPELSTVDTKEAEETVIVHTK